MTRPQYIAHLQKAIKAVYGADSTHVETVAVRETFKSKTVWEGDVEVFDLTGHAKAKRAYAWAYDVKTGSNTIAVLELPPVISPLTAVRAYVMSEARK
ncbi:MAG TPA: hypothetical protein VK737_07095 [Opitutales bacterium]|jgi:hypothetical protein|nr:hypothetical protein [Opitutales bacterium]